MTKDKTENKIAKIFRSGLYLVSTPIGNLRDITYRAVEVLQQADLIACEDTRVTGKLFSALSLERKGELLCYNDHNAESKVDAIISAIEKGSVVALVSDAGTPLISDPGYRIVNECINKGLYLTVVPGASAPISALQLSGFPSDNFVFLGFLPRTSKSRIEIFSEWKNCKASLICFESPSRVDAALEAMNEVFPDRQIAIVREITKMYEEALHGTPEQLIERINKFGGIKGEVVMVISPPSENEKIEYDDVAVMKLLTEAMRDHSLKDAVALIAGKTGWKKSKVYDKALSLKT